MPVEIIKLPTAYAAFSTGTISATDRTALRSHYQKQAARDKQRILERFSPKAPTVDQLKEGRCK